VTVPTVRTVVVTRDLAGPLDRAVRTLFGETWGRARSWIEAGKVRVGGAVATEPTSRVHEGIEISVDERAPRWKAAQLVDDEVVFIDAHVIVVAKPAGVSTVPFDESETDSLEARVRGWMERKHLVSGRQRPSLGVVHRLDKDTSGLIVFTRTWLAKQSLTGQFRRHTVHRRYVALAHGRVVSRQIRSFLVDNRGDGLRGSVRGTPPAQAREAITHVEALEALPQSTLVACRLETGRTHQIRIHLSESGHPILGDRVYTRRFPGPLIEAPRMMLHATELGFVHPATEQPMRWERAIPDDMLGVLARLRQGSP
jgi:23S rRNA pseudouridine1911/1915/1917 synthase